MQATNPIKVVKSLYYANKPATLNKNISRIKTTGPVDEYVKQMLNDGNELLEKTANDLNLSVNIAQKANSLLINSGAKTSFLDMGKMKHGSEIYDAIVNNMRENYGHGCGKLNINI